MLKSDSLRDVKTRTLSEQIMRDEHDAYGHEIMDYFNGKPAFEAIERDDGTVLLSGGPHTKSI